ncbi:hypothetical protein D3C77_724890 [compost metagenome]
MPDLSVTHSAAHSFQLPGQGIDREGDVVRRVTIDCLLFRLDRGMVDQSLLYKLLFYPGKPPHRLTFLGRVKRAREEGQLRLLPADSEIHTVVVGDQAILVV